MSKRAFVHPNLPSSPGAPSPRLRRHLGRLGRRAGRLLARTLRSPRWAGWLRGGAGRLQRRAAAVVVVAALAGSAVAGQASYSASSAPTTVTVRAGDSLWAIAQRYHVTVSQLAAANGMIPSEILQIGRTLVIPGTGTASSAKSSSRSSAVSLPSASAFCSHGFGGSEYGGLPGALADNPQLLALRPVFVEWADAYGLAPSYVEAVAWVESNWSEGAVSSANAIGVGQLLPSTAAAVNQRLGTNLSINSAADNIHMMAAYLSTLRWSVGDNLCLMTAAYNEGPYNLVHVGVYPVTQQYVEDVLADRARFE